MESLERGQNPYLRLLYSEAADLGVRILECPGVRFRWLREHANAIDVLHINWPSFYYEQPTSVLRWRRLALFSLFLLVARARGIRIVWTAHNLLPHNASPGSIDTVARRIVLHLASHVIAHRSDIPETLRTRFGKTPHCTVIPHMSYRGVYGPPVCRSVAREQLGLRTDSCVLLHLGGCRPNKNVQSIVAAVLKSPDSDSVLLVAGNAVGEVREELCALTQDDTRVVLHLDDVPDELIPSYLSAADVGIVAGELTTSGTFYLYLTFALPVIVHEKTVPPELSNASFVFGFDGSVDSLSRVMQRVRKSDLNSVAQAASEYADRIQPSRVSRQFLDVLSGLARKAVG